MSPRHVALILLAGTFGLLGCSRDIAPICPGVTTAPATAEALIAPPVTAGVSATAAQAPGPAVAPPPPGPVPGGPPPGDDTLELLAFFNADEPGAGNNDIFVQQYDQFSSGAVADINTPDNEINPVLVKQGKWLVFQRTVHAVPDERLFPGGVAPAGPPPRPQQDILIYDMETGAIATLPNLNTEAYDEYAPDVSADGSRIVYLSNRHGYPEVCLYDVKTAQNLEIPGLNRGFKDVTWPSISADGRRIAFGASDAPGTGVAADNTGNPTGGAAFTGGALTPAQSDVYVYDLASGQRLDPPQLNTPYDEFEPALSPDGRHMLFVTNRFGTEDVLEVDLASGALDNLSRLNTPRYDEEHPRYKDAGLHDILIQRRPLDAHMLLDLALYHRTTRLVEGVAPHAAKRAPSPALRPIVPPAPMVH